MNVPTEKLRTILPVADAFIVDIKDLDPAIYESYTGMPIDRTLCNLEILIQNKAPEHIHVRVPVIPDYNTEAHVQTSVEKLKEMGVTDIEVFPYVIRP